MPRRCAGCNKTTLGCIMGGRCPSCGWPDTHAGRFWRPEGEQPHFREFAMDLDADPEKALIQLDKLRTLGAAALDAEPDTLKPAAAALAGKRVRIVVAVEVVDG